VNANGHKASSRESKARSNGDESGKERYHLRLFVAGQTGRSVKSVENLKRLCEKYLKGRYELEVIDIYQQPSLATDNQIIAAPTLIKRLPLPLRRLVGDFSNQDRVLSGLDLRLA
jgi:circadian clock protein KaiB